MGNPWTDLVKEKFRAGKKLNVLYSLKDAMIEAKKSYKKGVSTNVTGKTRALPSKKKKRRTFRKGSRRR